MCLHVCLRPLQPFLLVGIGEGKYSFMHISKPLEEASRGGLSVAFSQLLC